VREDQLATSCPQIKLDHVDPYLQGGVERGKRIGRRERTRPTVPDPNEAIIPVSFELSR
jgi:hypothetical protein